jgi:hypothetical protein
MAKRRGPPKTAQAIARRVYRKIGLSLAAGGLFALLVVGYAWYGARELARRIEREGVYVAAACTITEVTKEGDSEDGVYFSLRYRVPADGEYYGTKYKARGNTVDSDDALERELRPGSSHRCWYDPDDPSQAVLVRSSVGDDSAVAWVVGLTFGLGMLLTGLLLALIKPNLDRPPPDW